ncbi:MAG: S1C family serine protease [Pirellulaceae bacterium]
MKFWTRWSLILFVMIAMQPWHAHAQRSLSELISEVQPRMVKIFGAGGLRRLESWQSGFLISSDGLVVTVWSYVLDSEDTTVVLDNGQRLSGKLVGYHPQYELALLRVDVENQTHFDLANPIEYGIGQPILAFSNLYGVATGNEQCSVQAGVVSAVTPLRARRGTRPTNYSGPALILDAITSNPGAAGGAITDRSGRLLGLIGREARSTTSNLWLNYAIPAEQVAVAVDLILAGQTSDPAPMTVGQEPTESLTPGLLGVVLVSDVVARTPPFVDFVEPQSPAARAGIQPDDLIVEIDGQVTASQQELREHMARIDRDRQVSLTLQRGNEFLTITLQAK